MAFLEWIRPNYKEWFAYIFIGAGALYLFGFGVMCLMVREGGYPPPPENVDKRKGIISSIRTYARECFTHKFYWYFFLMNTFFAVASLSGTYGGLRDNFSLDLDLHVLGRMGVWMGVVTLVILPFLGWLADKLNPIRVFMAMSFILFLNPIINCVFIFRDFGKTGNTYFLYALSLVILPFDSMLDTVGSPMYMRLLPKERYGQFSSANAALRALVRIGMSVVVAVVWTYLIDAVGENMAYRLWPVWTIIFQIPALVCLALLYREWKRLGGKDNYVPPQV
jgi:maltose/moltooligosaccharide transporter